MRNNQLPPKEGNSKIEGKYKIVTSGRIDAGFGNFSCNQTINRNNTTIQ
jgi:hypothetical protein